MHRLHNMIPYRHWSHICETVVCTAIPCDPGSDHRYLFNLPYFVSVTPKILLLHLAFQVQKKNFVSQKLFQGCFSKPPLPDSSSGPRGYRCSPRSQQDGLLGPADFGSVTKIVTTEILLLHLLI